MVFVRVQAQDQGGGSMSMFVGSLVMGGVPSLGRITRLEEFHQGLDSGVCIDLAENRRVSVAEMSELGQEEGGEAWRWKRRLFAWEEETLRELVSLLHNFLLQINAFDRWSWLLDSVKGYSVSGAYHYLTDADAPSDKDSIDNIWHKQVPLFLVRMAASTQQVTNQR